MKTQQQDAESRQYRRNNVQRVIVIINDKPYLTKDWSPDGFAIKCDDQKLEFGEIVTGIIDVFDVDEKGEFKAKLVHADDNHLMAFQFTEISAHIFMNLCITVNVDENGQVVDDN